MTQITLTTTVRDHVEDYAEYARGLYPTLSSEIRDLLGRETVFARYGGMALQNPTIDVLLDHKEELFDEMEEFVVKNCATLGWIYKKPGNTPVVEQTQLECFGGGFIKEGQKWFQPQQIVNPIAYFTEKQVKSKREALEKILVRMNQQLWHGSTVNYGEFNGMLGLIEALSRQGNRYYVWDLQGSHLSSKQLHNMAVFLKGNGPFTDVFGSPALWEYLFPGQDAVEESVLHRLGLSKDQVTVQTDIALDVSEARDGYMKNTTCLVALSNLPLARKCMTTMFRQFLPLTYVLLPNNERAWVAAGAPQLLGGGAVLFKNIGL